ncbi:STAS domain-containing protein [Bacillus altitudinis]|uniref:STAS domain-containing protein n=1 Tax=Bacillus altitudinis TaxID=293387 RepID=UPI00064CA710|nr:STAS domain-containing protein [Bacillus altitudinis]KLV15214.1 anti-sigma-factor antagonist [Bacillus altitudinis]MCY7692160.1 STAS domain-containing protein [Bacillus altitudinis]MCY7696331.1 STAS domain-containing protein [Bacillus altitudinis]
MTGLQIKKEVHESTTTLYLHGILDISTTGSIDPFLEDMTMVKRLVIDFSGLDFIDSTGIGSIMNAIYLSQEKDFTLRLQGVDELTHQVFEMVGLYQILEALNGEVV